MIGIDAIEIALAHAPASSIDFGNWCTLGAKPTDLRAYTKAALAGTSGDSEHGAAMIQPRLGMAMRRTIKSGHVITPGHAKVGPPGTQKGVDALVASFNNG